MAVGPQVSQTISICGYTFDGPYTYTALLEDRAGVYTVLDKRWDGKWYILDVGESTQVKTRLEIHDRAPCWNRHKQGLLGFAALYTSGWTADQRRTLELKIRQTYNPPCGER